MKSYIIDTHVLIWDLKEDYIGNLSDNIKEILSTEKNICVSIASLWEIAIKNNLGQLDINGTVYDIEEFCEENEIAILPIKAGHLETVCCLYHKKKDFISVPYEPKNAEYLKNLNM